MNALIIREIEQIELLIDRYEFIIITPIICPKISGKEKIKLVSELIESSTKYSDSILVELSFLDFSAKEKVKVIKRFNGKILGLIANDIGELEIYQKFEKLKKYIGTEFGIFNSDSLIFLKSKYQLNGIFIPPNSQLSIIDEEIISFSQVDGDYISGTMCGCFFQKNNYCPTFCILYDNYEMQNEYYFASNVIFNTKCGAIKSVNNYGIEYHDFGISSKKG